MMIDVQSNLSSMSMSNSDSVSVTAVPATTPDHNNDSDMWWDSYVTQFPCQYYTLLSPSDYEELFGDDDEEMLNDEEMFNDEGQHNAKAEVLYFTKEPDNITCKPATMYVDATRQHDAAREYDAVAATEYDNATTDHDNTTTDHDDHATEKPNLKCVNVPDRQGNSSQ